MSADKPKDGGPAFPIEADQRGGGMSVHIYAPQPMYVRIVKVECATCGRRTYQVVAVYEWHGPDATCLRCGERYNEDGRVERPFARGWREESKRKARAFYRRFNPEEGGNA